MSHISNSHSLQRAELFGESLKKYTGGDSIKISNSFPTLSIAEAKKYLEEALKVEPTPDEILIDELKRFANFILTNLSEIVEDTETKTIADVIDTAVEKFAEDLS